jgi:hypothetical protein
VVPSHHQHDPESRHQVDRAFGKLPAIHVRQAKISQQTLNGARVQGEKREDVRTGGECLGRLAQISDRPGHQHPRGAIALGD